MKNKLTVGLPTASFFPRIGGAQITVHNIAMGLISKGHNPVVMVPFRDFRQLKISGKISKYPYKIIPTVPKVNYILEKLPWLGFKIMDSYFFYILAKYKIDIWHCTINYPLGLGLVHYYRKKEHNPVIIRSVGYDIQIDHKLKYGIRLRPKIDQLIKKWLPKANKLIAITESVEDEYRKIGIDDSKIVKIPNGVDYERFQKNYSKTCLRKKYDIAKDAQVFLSIGRYHNKKNFDILLEVAQKLKEQSYTQFLFVMAGTGMNAMLAKIQNLNLTDCFKIIDPIPNSDMTNEQLHYPQNEIVELYKLADLFVFPSLIETFGIVLIEAMAAGLPVITTLSPGCKYVVRSGEDAVVVKSNSVNSYVEEIKKLMLSKEQRELYRERGLSRAKDFSWDSVLNRYIDIYYRELNNM